MSEPILHIGADEVNEQQKLQPGRGYGLAFTSDASEAAKFPTFAKWFEDWKQRRAGKQARV